MPAKVFLDTNVLIYGLTETDGKKKARARELLSDRNSVLSTQVLFEATNVLIKKAGVRPGDAASLLRKFLGRQVVPQTPETLEEAWRIADRYGFGIYDAAIVAAALTARCGILYTENLQHEQTIETLRVLNPFL